MGIRPLLWATWFVSLANVLVSVSELRAAQVAIIAGAVLFFWDAARVLRAELRRRAG